MSLTTVNAALRAMSEALRWVREEFEPDDAEWDAVRQQLILTLGGFLVEPPSREPSALDWDYSTLEAMERDGQTAYRLKESFPGWNAHPSRPLSSWLKVAPEATVLRVRATLREIGQEI